MSEQLSSEEQQAAAEWKAPETGRPTITGTGPNALEFAKPNQDTNEPSLRTSTGPNALEFSNIQNESPTIEVASNHEKNSELTNSQVFDSLWAENSISGLGLSLGEAKMKGWEGVSTEIGYYGPDRLIATLSEAQKVADAYGRGEINRSNLRGALIAAGVPRGAEGGDNTFPFLEAVAKVIENTAQEQ